MSEPKQGFRAPYEGAHPFGGQNAGQTLYGPDGSIVCDLTKSEPEDRRTWDWDLKPVVDTLNSQQDTILKMREASRIIAALQIQIDGEVEHIHGALNMQNFDKAMKHREEKRLLETHIEAQRQIIGA